MSTADRGVRPYLSRKYDITKHPNYKLLSDFNEKNAFNIEKFLLPGCRCVPVNDTVIMKSQPKIWFPRLYKVVPACQSMWLGVILHVR